MQTPSPLALSVVLALALPALMLWIVLLVLPQMSLYAAGCCKYGDRVSCGGRSRIRLLLCKPVVVDYVYKCSSDLVEG